VAAASEPMDISLGIWTFGLLSSVFDLLAFICFNFMGIQR
jgi:hypothetical protein